MEYCCVCGEEIFEGTSDVCEDCMDADSLEDLLDKAFGDNNHVS